MTTSVKPNANATPRVPMRPPASTAAPGPPMMSTAVPTASAAKTRELLTSGGRSIGTLRGSPAWPTSRRAERNRGPRAIGASGPAGSLGDMARSRTETVLVTRWDGERASRQPDEVIVEEPMAIQLDGHLVATTMRTPGHDYELAAGFCHTEGLLAGEKVETVRYC